MTSNSNGAVSGERSGTSLEMRLFRMMQLIRRTEELLMQEYHPADEMRCPIHFCVGQEAAPAALSILLEPEDVLMSHHRSHGYYLAKGAPLGAMVAEFYGKASGSNGGLAGSQELSYEAVNFYSGTILSGIFAIAAGDAFATKYRRDGHITIAVIGDGGMEEGIVFETLNFAAVFRLPVLFLCENNLFSAHSRIDVRSVSRNVTGRVAGFGVKTALVDGNDPLETYAQLAEIVRLVRAGDGPAFVELITYRTCGHVGSEDDDHLGYRLPEELLKWRQRDPVSYLRSVLLARGVAARELDRLIADIDAEVLAAIEVVKRDPVPDFTEAVGFNSANAYAPVVTMLVDGAVSELDPKQHETRLRPY